MRHFAPLLLLVAACNSAPPESSVRPGVNERYLSGEFTAEKAVEVFEGESREIFVARAEIVAALALETGEDVADIGAGTGVLLEDLVRAVGPDGDVYAVELTPQFRTHLAQRSAHEGWDNVRVVACTERTTELPRRSIDAAILCDVYHHLEYPRTTMTSLRRALRRGGRVAVVEFERIEGVSRKWVLEHVRAGRETFIEEIEACGFELEREVEIDAFEESYLLVFRRR